MSEKPSIEELVRDSQQGSRSAFDALASIHQSELEAFVVTRLGPFVRSQLDPKDVTQDAFLKAYEGLDRFRWRDSGSFGRWLRAIAEHLIRNASRKRSVPLQKVSLEIPGSDTSPSRAMRRNERFDRLQDALQALSPEHREVVELARIRGLKAQEIADRMGRSPGAVRLLLFRALEQLRNRFGDTASLNLPDRAMPTGGEDQDA